jgi:hypothetical protein
MMLVSNMAMVQGWVAEHPLLVHTQRRVATQAFVLDRRLMPGVHQHLMAHLGLEEGVPRAVGHQRAAPVVGHVHIASLSVDAGQAHGVVPVASGATTSGGEVGTEEHWKVALAAQQGQFKRAMRPFHRANRLLPRGEERDHA